MSESECGREHRIYQEILSDAQSPASHSKRVDEDGCATGRKSSKVRACRAKMDLEFPSVSNRSSSIDFIAFRCSGEDHRIPIPMSTQVRIRMCHEELNHHCQSEIHLRFSRESCLYSHSEEECWCTWLAQKIGTTGANLFDKRSRSRSYVSHDRVHDACTMSSFSICDEVSVYTTVS